jgi:hypothetical protein
VDDRWTKLGPRKRFWESQGRSNAASYRKVVRPVGFEPTAFCSGGKRSIQTELRARKQRTWLPVATHESLCHVQDQIESFIRNEYTSKAYEAKRADPDIPLRADLCARNFSKRRT